jgi:hypothetical protein
MIASKLELALVIFLLFLPERAGKMTLRGLNSKRPCGRDRRASKAKGKQPVFMASLSSKRRYVHRILRQRPQGVSLINEFCYV